MCVCQYLSIPLLSYTQNKYPLFQSWVLKSLFCFVLFKTSLRNIYTDSHCSPSPIKVKNCVSEINTSSSALFSQPIVIPKGICGATHAHGLHLYCVEQIESLKLYFLSSLNSSKKEMGDDHPCNYFLIILTIRERKHHPSPTLPSPSHCETSKGYPMPLRSASWINSGCRTPHTQKIRNRFAPKPFLIIVNLHFRGKGKTKEAVGKYELKVCQSSVYFCIRKFYF